MKISTNVRRIALFFLSMVLSLGFAIAQERTITGTVTADGEGSVPGVNILIKGTMNGAITDVNGAYSIKVPGDATVLVFSSVGYVTQEVTVGSQAVIDVVLKTDVVSLQEVVVTGYTTQRKRDITGAIGVVESDKLKAIPSGNVTNQLQGQSSGVTVTGSGQPGENSKVRIRGFASFQDNNPLYIVDGVPTQDISTLNPNDIQTLSVLKDAGAASVYGSRASNGVIIVTTKSGGKGIKVNYDMYTGTQYAGSGPDNLLNAQEYANLQWLVYRNDGTSETHPLYGPSSNANPTLPSWGADTKWYDVITRNAPVQNHDVSLSGGNDKAKFFAGLGYFDQKGIIITNFTKRYTGRFNSEWTFLNDRVKVGENLTISYRENNVVANQEEGSPIQMGPYRSQPLIPYIITDEIVGTSHTFVPGEYGGTGIAPRLGNSTNPYADLIRGADDTHHNLHMIGSAYVDVTLLKGLSFRSTFGGTWDNGYNVDYSYATYERAENVGTPSLSEYAYWGSDWVWTNQLTLNKTFGQHRIVALAGYEAVKYGIGRNMTAARAGYYTNAVDFRTLNNGATIQTATSDAYTQTTLVSMFGKADYSFKDKYLLSATVRRDGSSRFGADNRYGVFPSFSAGWRVSGEPFFSSIGWINDLKVRGSYGTMGNQLAVSPDNQFFLYGGSANQSNYDLNGTGTSSLQGFRPTRIGNPNAKWETNITTNVGFEAQFWNNKLGVVFDYYTKNTEDLLFDPELPGTAGNASPPFVNIASMKNHGVDFEVSFKNTWGDLGVNASATMTTYKNEITKIAEGVPFFDYGDSRIGANTRNMVGQPISAFYGYQVEGLFQSDAEVDAAPVQDGAEPGFFRYANLDQTPNGDGDQVIGPDDRTIIGNPNPKFTYGFNLGFNYKNWDLSTFIYGSYGNDILNFNTWWIDFWPSFQGQKSTELLYDSWTPERTGGSVPKASNKSNFSTNTVWNSYYVEDGSFLRMKNLTLGYTLPESLLGKVGVKNLRVYIQGVNLFTLTKYSGLDPEIGSQYQGSTNDRSFGVDYGNYPTVRQFIFGLNLGL